MADLVEVLVDRMFGGARGIVGNDGLRLLGGDIGANGIRIISGVGNDGLSGQAVHERGGLWRVASLSGGHGKPHRAAKAAHGHMDLARQTAARATDGLSLRPPFLAPAACWWARTMVESTMRYSKSGSFDKASKRRSHTPFWLHRLKRRNTLFHSPNTSGRSRHGEPVRAIHNTPSMNMRLFRPVEPRCSGRPMIRPEMRSQCASL